MPEKNYHQYKTQTKAVLDKKSLYVHVLQYAMPEHTQMSDFSSMIASFIISNSSGALHGKEQIRQMSAYSTHRTPTIFHCRKNE